LNAIILDASQFATTHPSKNNLKTTSESQAIMNSLFMIEELILTIFLEYGTQKKQWQFQQTLITNRKG